MKILHIAGFDMLYKSGIGEVVMNLAKAQKNAGNDVFILNTTIQQENKNIEANITIINNDFDFKVYVSKLNPEIVIFYAFYVAPFLKYYKILKALEIPYLIQPQGAFGKSNQQKGFLKKKLANFFFFNAFIKYSAGILYLNKTEQSISVFNWFQRSFILPNGVDTNISFNISKEPANPLQLIFLSRIDIIHKGIDFLLDAIHLYDKQLAQQSIVIDLYGYGEVNDIKYVEEKIKYLTTKVNLKKPVFEKEKEKVLSEADIFLLTSRYEGMPVAILEALSYAVPCFVTPGTNMTEEIEKNNAGWVTELNADLIGKNLLKAIENYRMNYKIIRENARNCVVDNYEWKAIAQKSFTIYNKVINPNI